MYTRLTVIVVSVIFALILGSGIGMATTDVPVEGDAAVELAPHAGPNGQYATIDGDGKLQIDFERLLDDSTTRADNVFNVTASGDRTIEIWIEHDSEGTTFYQGADLTAAIDEGSRVTVSPGDTIEIGIFMDTRQPDAELTTITIFTKFVEPDEAMDSQVTRQSDIRVIDLIIPEKRVVAGERTTITTTVKNFGDAPGDDTIVLSVEGIDVDRQSVRLDPDDVTTLEFERTFQLPGEYRIQVGEFLATIIVVEPAVPAPRFSVIDVSVDPTTVEPGEPVTVTTHIANTGERGGTFIAELSVDYAVHASATTYVPAGETSSVVFERSFDDDGERTIAVSGIEGETITVITPSALPGRILPSTHTQAAALSVTALVVLVLWRREWRNQLIQWVKSNL